MFLAKGDFNAALILDGNFNNKVSSIPPIIFKPLTTAFDANPVPVLTALLSGIAIACNGPGKTTKANVMAAIRYKESFSSALLNWASMI